jgi:hypothetical protein
MGSETFFGDVDSNLIFSANLYNEKGELIEACAYNANAWPLDFRARPTYPMGTEFGVKGAPEPDRGSYGARPHPNYACWGSE